MVLSSSSQEGKLTSGSTFVDKGGQGVDVIVKKAG